MTDIYYNSNNADKKDDIIYNIYIDESCHLEYDKYPIMCIGYIKIDKTKYFEFSNGIKQIKIKHHSPMEIKWSKVSYSRIELYKDLIDYFCDNEIEFRCVRIVNKDKINNEQFNQKDHDVFYYKAAFYLLRFNIENNHYNRVFMDIKDNYGKKRLNLLSSILNKVCNNKFIHFQHIRSHENQFIQLTDLFIGAIAYSYRNDINKTSKAKKEIISYMEDKFGFKLTQGTPPSELKFNIFDFHLRESI